MGCGLGAGCGGGGGSHHVARKILEASSALQNTVLHCLNHNLQKLYSSRKGTYSWQQVPWMLVMPDVVMSLLTKGHISNKNRIVCQMQRPWSWATTVPVPQCDDYLQVWLLCRMANARSSTNFRTRSVPKHVKYPLSRAGMVNFCIIIKFSVHYTSHLYINVWLRAS